MPAVVGFSEGLGGIECFYSRYSEEDEAMLLEIALEKGLLVSGGSDYHGENKTVKLGALRSDECEIEVDKISVLTAITER